MTERKFVAGDLVRATDDKGIKIEAHLTGGGAPSGPYIPYTGVSANSAPKAWTIELLEPAKSASQKALDDAPRNSFIRRGEMNRTFWKGRNLKWYEIQHDYHGDPPKIIEVEGDDLTYCLPKWLDNGIQTLHVPEGY